MFNWNRKVVEPGACDVALEQSLAKAGEEPKRGGFASRLALAFASTAAFTAVVAVFISSIVWGFQFDSYVRNNLQGIADTIATSGARAYVTYGGWNFSSFAVIPQVGARSEVAVQILSNDGRIVYDEASLRAHAEQMQGQEPESKGSSGVDVALMSRPLGEVMTAPIMVDDEQIGTVRVWAYGSSALLTERDIQLRTSSLFALAAAGIIGIIISSFAGFLYSRKLTSPLNCITQTAMEIRSGNSSARTRLTGDDEISLLAETFDKMADSIEADRMLERRLTNDVAHELRTPLMAIQATVEAMEDGVLPMEAAQLQSIQRETKRLSRLTNAILELARLENHSLSMNLQPINVATPVLAALDAHAALFELGSLSVVTDIDNTLTVNADMDRIQQAVANLLSNAARYTLENGIISISVQRSGSFAVIDVKDTGIGMTQDDLGKLFTRFWRADSARDRASGGIGVGLAITKEIIDRHGGRVDVSSQPGEGTTFSIFLPLLNNTQKKS